MKKRNILKYLVLLLSALSNSQVCEADIISNLILWLPLNGTYADYSTKNVLITSPTNTLSYSQGRCLVGSKAAYFNETHSLNFPRSALSSIDSSHIFSIAAWIKTNLNSSLTPILITSNGEWAWKVSNTIMAFSFSSTTTNSVGIGTVSSGVWHHFGLAGTDTVLYYYVDGIRIKTQTMISAPFTNTASYVYVGSTPHASVSLVGLISDLRIYSYQKTDNDFKELASACPFDSSSNKFEIESSAHKLFSSSVKQENKQSSSSSFASNYQQQQKIATTSSLSSKPQYFVIVLISIDTTTITSNVKFQLENEIAIVLGINVNEINVILISSNEIQVTITGQSLSDVSDSANQLINIINNGFCNN